MMKKKSVRSMLTSLLIFAFVSTGSCLGQEQSHEGEGEESGTRYKRTETCKEVRRGVELSLSYDKASESFIGTIKNVSSQQADRARVEVHLSNGVELGPTKAVNLKPGTTKKVKLDAKGQQFKWWSTHAEVGSSEHGHGEGGEHKHGGEGAHTHN